MKNVDGTVFVVAVAVVFTMISFGLFHLKGVGRHLVPVTEESHLIWGRLPIPLSTRSVDRTFSCTFIRICKLWSKFSCDEVPKNLECCCY